MTTVISAFASGVAFHMAIQDIKKKDWMSWITSTTLFLWNLYFALRGAA